MRPGGTFMRSVAVVVVVVVVVMVRTLIAAPVLRRQ
jgi:hypothetical protein